MRDKTLREYRKTATVKAKLFQQGDEDGMSCIPYVAMCQWKDQNGDYKQCTKCTLDIPKMPYIGTLENERHFGEWGEEYICTGIQEEKWLVKKDIFEETYEEVKD